MKIALLDLLACPACRGALRLDDAKREGDDVVAGSLACAACAKAYPVERGIPRFVPADDYASSFGYQWNRFKWEQIDADNATRQSAGRLHAETGWDWGAMRGRWTLDAGCGAGRFLDVAARSDAQVVGLDISSAIDAAAEVTRGKPNVHLVQGSVLAPPFRPGAFDDAYCIGVLQHTPAPLEGTKRVAELVKPGGRVALTYYEKRRFTRLNAKYVVRPLTKRMRHTTLLRAIRVAMPVAWPVTEVLYRVPLAGRAFRFAIPVANYVEKKDLSWRQRYRWAVLDTFDMLSPAFDDPQTEPDVRRALDAVGVRDVRRLANPGLNVVGVRA